MRESGNVLPSRPAGKEKVACSCHLKAAVCVTVLVCWGQLPSVQFNFAYALTLFFFLFFFSFFPPG